MKHPIRTALLPVLCLGGIAFALPRTQVASDRPSVRPLAGSLHPGVQAGRLKLASPVGGYVDLGAPLTVHEAAALGSYRAFHDERRACSRAVLVPETASESPEEALDAPERNPGPRTQTV